MTKKPDSELAAVAHKAAKYAMFGGAAVAGVQQNVAVAQETTASTVDEIIVTGSRIRRVDAETAVPIQIINAEAIQQSGVTTLGELITRLPSIGGAATNPATNNGGGDGATNIELRGLDVKRTLVLLNGRRYGALGNLTSAVDVNSIPVNMIERVEVLKQGAGAVYGSDAIGGVVNFITKKTADGAEISLDYGFSSEDDGDRTGVSLSWGADNDRGSLIMGLNYNQQDAISAADREFSRNAIYFYGSVFNGGSSRTPTARIRPDQAILDQLGCGGNSVTRIDGATGDGPLGILDVDDFRCFITSGDDNDFYNYQPLNLIVTPQERASVFTLGSWKVTDDIEAYTEFSYNRTKSGYQIAPLPFDARDDKVIISEDSIYNPFGQSFGGDPDSNGIQFNDFDLRMEALGNRRNEVETFQGQIVGGLRGDLLETGWNWDVSAGYSRLDQDTKTSGYLLRSAIQNAVGPSFIDENGNPVCGVEGGTIILGCVPINIFNVQDPGQIEALKRVSADYNDTYSYAMSSVAGSMTGKAFDLPAGPVEVAIGAEYRDQKGEFDTDFNSTAQAPLFNECQLAQETCSGDQFGSYDVKEVYGEALFPLLKDAPFATALNLTAGVRYSDYSTFGDTTNFTFKLDWKPIEDLMVRATYSEIFRAPSIIEIYQAPTANAPTFTDPCVALTQVQVDDPNTFYELACENVVADGTFEQPNGQISALLLGANVAGVDLKPEEGEAFTVGFVYEPEWLSGLSLTVDYWDYSIDDIITQLDSNTIANACVRTGSEAFCGLIDRFPDGSVQQIRESTVNLGQLDTDGLDFSILYRLSDTPIGSWSFGAEATYTDSYDSVVLPGDDVIEVAGYYDRQYGNIAEWRGTFTIDWDLADFAAQLAFRYHDSVKLTDPDGSPCIIGGCPADRDPLPEELGPSADLVIASQTYIDFSGSYNIEATGTKIQIGVNNLGDNQPPILYQNNVLNSNTDVATYDTIGRYFFGSITQKF